MSGSASDLLDALNVTVRLARVRAGDRIPVVGVAGAQGSGKTTLAKLVADLHPTVATFSFDDVYLPLAARRNLARNIHPLLQTRGPPGTHDIELYNATLDELLRGGEQAAIPVFDKIADERVERSRWRNWSGSPRYVLVEGWCLGATAQDAAPLVAPVNALETQEDGRCVWREYVNAQLSGPYRAAWDRIDALLYLKPPSFDVVLRWRQEQQETLLGRRLIDAERASIARFVQHFERITRHMMAGGVRADAIAHQDEERRVVSVTKGIGGAI